MVLRKQPVSRRIRIHAGRFRFERVAILDAMHVPSRRPCRLARYRVRQGTFSVHGNVSCDLAAFAAADTRYIRSRLKERLAHALLSRHDYLKENAVTIRPLAIALAPLLSLAIAEAAFAQNPKTDMQFATTAARGGQAEIALGQMAATKAQSADVKAFGQKMVSDHKKAGDELDAAARADGETIPKGLEAQHKIDAARFDKLSGAAFDKAYMKQMVEDHQKTVALFEKEATSGKDSHVKQFAQATLPTLREHLKMAQDLESRTDGASAQSSK